jgi:hypothetical protein
VTLRSSLIITLCFVLAAVRITDTPALPLLLVVGLLRRVSSKGCRSDRLSCDLPIVARRLA